MAGLVPAIHVFLLLLFLKTWMPGTSPGMTKKRNASHVEKHRLVVALQADVETIDRAAVARLTRRDQR
jgi:hypothetical protein